MRKLILVLGLMTIVSIATPASVLAAQRPQRRPPNVGQQARPGAPRVLRMPALRERLRRLDANHDRQISRDEWRGAATRFDRLDRNRDSRLTPGELRRAVRPGRAPR